MVGLEKYSRPTLRDQDQDRKYQDQDQDLRSQDQDQDQDQDREKSVSSALETKTAVSRTTSLLSQLCLVEHYIYSPVFIPCSTVYGQGGIFMLPLEPQSIPMHNLVLHNSQYARTLCVQNNHKQTIQNHSVTSNFSICLPAYQQTRSSPSMK